jgi:Holliday junction DNA helicase RuvA
MIVFLEGLLDEKEPTRAVIETGGVGYEVFIPLSSFDKLPAEGQRLRIHIFDHVREDAHTLFGFMTAEERRMFMLLLGVTGIGPKLALSVLSGLTTRDLKGAILGGDAKRLSSVPGIGKKTAERIILDLKDKFKGAEALESLAPVENLTPEAVKTRDAVLALVALGYKRGEAEALIRQTLSGLDVTALDVETLIRKALAG